MELDEKIKYEWKNYMCNIKLMSKTDILTHSFEISVKQAIYKRLMDDINNGSTESFPEDVMAAPDLIDTLYHAFVSGPDTMLDNGSIKDMTWEYIKKSVFDKGDVSV